MTISLHEKNICALTMVHMPTNNTKWDMGYNMIYIYIVYISYIYIYIYIYKYIYTYTYTYTYIYTYVHIIYIYTYYKYTYYIYIYILYIYIYTYYIYTVVIYTYGGVYIRIQYIHIYCVIDTLICPSSIRAPQPKNKKITSTNAHACVHTDKGVYKYIWYIMLYNVQYNWWLHL